MFTVLKNLFIFAAGAAGALVAILLIKNLTGDVEPLGYHLNFSLEKSERSRYVDKIDKFSFLFPKNFEIDISTQSAKLYGKDYLVGFKEKNDSRIGCEVRKSASKLDLTLSEEELSRSLSQQFGGGGSRFKVTRAGKISLNALPAFQFNFNFIDPLNSVAAVNQVLVPNGDITYNLMCGAGKAYFDKFARDFAFFFNSFRFEEDKR